MLKAVILMSGGLDSLATLAYAKDMVAPRDITCLFFDYGQRALARERKAARVICKHYKVPLVEEVMHFSWMKASGLTGRELKDYKDEVSRRRPTMYVPMRNLQFLVAAGALAEVLGACEVWSGVLRPPLEAPAVPDTKSTFIAAAELALNLGSSFGDAEEPLTLETPFIHCTKQAVWDAAQLVNAPVHLAWSCHREGPAPCGKCSACIDLAEVTKRH